MELQVGKRYQMRGGDVVTIDSADHPEARISHHPEFYQFGGWHDGMLMGWRADGRFYHHECVFDLVAEVAVERPAGDEQPVIPFGELVEQPLVPRSYVRNCVLIQRGSEMLFNSTDAGILATLDGYAVIPRELYDELSRR